MSERGRAPFPVDAATVSEVAGPYALSYSSSNPQVIQSQDRWARGAGTAQVIEIATGKTRYAVTARQITRRAGVSGAPGIGLQPDGSLSTFVPARRSERVRPVAVDPSGRVHRLGRALRHVGSVGAVIKGSRALVEVTGRDRVKSALWLVSNTGKRGHRLSRVDGQKFTRDLPGYWDGDAAVWETTGPRDRDGVWVTTRLKCLSLSSRHVPTSKAVR